MNKLLKRELLLTGIAFGAVFVKNIFTHGDIWLNTPTSMWLPGYPGVPYDYQGDPELIGVCGM